MTTTSGYSSTIGSRSISAGLHSAQSDQLILNDRAAELGIQPGNVYPLDFFHAERHTSQSNFKIQSTLKFTNCNPIVY